MDTPDMLSRPTWEVPAMREALSQTLGLGGPYSTHLRLLIGDVELDRAIARFVAHVPQRLSWWELSTTERITLRFLWEAYHRTTCPFPLQP